MRHFALAVLTGLAVVSSATAHFVFVVPSADGTKAQVILSDSLTPDENVDIAKIAAMSAALFNGATFAAKWPAGN